MFGKRLLSQTAGTKLKFSPANSMGFTSGGNFVVVSIHSYSPSSTAVNLMFVEGPEVPAEQTMGVATYTSSYNSAVKDVQTQGDVESAIMDAIVADAISYLKGFNSGCSFEPSEFAQKKQ